MNDTAVTIHGIRVDDGGAGSVDVFVPWLIADGINVDSDSGDYGRISHFGVRKGLAIRARDPETGELMAPLGERLYPALARAKYVITHSNGANMGMQALNLFDNYLSPYSKVVIHFAPAMSRKVKVPKCVREMIVVHSRNDRVVAWLAAIAKFWTPGFGTAGAYGYNGGDPRVINFDAAGKADDHSDYWAPPQRAQFFYERCVQPAIRRNTDW